MLVTEVYMTREDGVNLVRTYSDLHHYILQEDTGIMYEEAVDVENIGHTYFETDTEITDPNDV